MDYLILAFIITVIILAGANSKRVSAIILRTVAAVLLLVFVVQPLLKLVFNKWLSRRTLTEQERSGEVLEMLPALKSLVPDAYAITKTDTGFFNRLSSFLLAMIILTLYAGKEEQHHHI
jgi:fumarate reductase subunit D